MLFRCVFLCLTAVLFYLAAIQETAGADGGLRIQGRVRENPTLCFKGISGDSKVSAAVGSFLKACGWFDVVKEDNADYTITGSSSGGRTTLNVAMAGAPLAAWNVSSPDERRTAKLLVDALLEGPEAFRGTDPIDAYCGLWDTHM